MKHTGKYCFPKVCIDITCPCKNDSMRKSQMQRRKVLSLRSEKEGHHTDEGPQVCPVGARASSTGSPSVARWDPSAACGGTSAARGGPAAARGGPSAAGGAPSAGLHARAGPIGRARESGEVLNKGMGQ